MRKKNHIWQWQSKKNVLKKSLKYRLTAANFLIQVHLNQFQLVIEFKGLIPSRLYYDYLKKKTGNI